MDIDLLSKMVKELILDNDEVYLPGIGSFVAELVPSTFSDKGYTINPPYRRLYFRQRQDGTDTALIDFYIHSNNLEKEAGQRIIKDFLQEMKEVLEQKKNIVFPGLGRLRATRENNFFFVADEDLDIYPEGFGLEPVSLKTHQETKEEVAAALDDLKFIMVEDNKVSDEGRDEEDTQEIAIEIFEDVSVEASEEIITETAEKANIEASGENAEEAAKDAAEEAFAEAEGENKDSCAEGVKESAAISAEKTVEDSVMKTDKEASKEKTDSIHPALVIIIFIAIVAITALIALIILGHISPEFIDKFLYGSEDLEIIKFNSLHS